MTGMRQDFGFDPGARRAERHDAESLDDGPRERAHPPETDRRRTELARTIEGEIIPRLMLAYRQVQGDPALGEVAFSTPSTMLNVDDFARLVMARDEGLAAAHVENLCRVGVALETIFLELFAPTARHLGRLWEEDICDFTDVTVGLGCLQGLLRRYSPARTRGASIPTGEFRTLLTPGPGEQHTFGLFMVEEFFRREGWLVRSEPSMTERQLGRIVRADWYDVVGFSLSCTDLIDRLASAIRCVRRTSCNPATTVLVGGVVFTDRQDLAKSVGADGTAADGLQATRLAAARATVNLRQC